MADKLYIEIENNNNDMATLINRLKAYSDIELQTHSSTGIEIATFIIGVGQFIIALIEVPMLIDFFFRQEITVKISGIKLKDSVTSLLNIIENNPTLLEDARTSIQEKKLEVEGRGSAVTNFLVKLEHLVNTENS